MELSQKLKEDNFSSYEHEKDDILAKEHKKKKRGKEGKHGLFISSYGGKNNSFLETNITKKRRGDDGKVHGEYGLEACRKFNLSFAHTEYKDKEKRRPKSVIHKSIPSKTKILPQSHERKRCSNSYIIESLIRETLKKTKQRKIKQKKVNKLTEIINKIKKSETDFHNHQIRLQNSKNLSRKHKKKVRHSPCLENNLYSLKTDTSNKIKPNEFRYLDSEVRCKRSSSAIDNYSTRNYPISMTPVIISKKKKPVPKISKKTANTLNSMKPVLDLLQRPMFTVPLISKSSKNSNISIDLASNSSDYEINEDKYKVNRNISVINDRSSERSFNQEEFPDTQFNTYQHIYRKNNESKDDTLKTEFHASAPKHINQNFSLGFDKQVILKRNLSIVSENNLFILPTKQKTILDIHTQPDKITISRIEGPELGMQTQNTGFLLISPLEKIKEIENTLVKQQIFSQSQPDIHSFTTESLSTIEYLPKPSQKILSQSQNLEESLSLNFAQIFVIEQLRKYEIIGLENPNILIPSQISGHLEAKIEKKYSALLSNLNKMMNSYCSEILENYSMTQHRNFVQKLQIKKQNLYEILLENVEECMVPVKSSSFISGSDKSNSSSEEELKTGISGITHSRSLKFLHQDLSAKGKNSVTRDGVALNSSKDSKNALFFGFQDEISEDRPSEQTKTETLEDEALFMPTHFKAPSSIHEIKETMRNKYTDIDRVCEFIGHVLRSLDAEKLLSELEISLSKDPLVELIKVGELQIGELTGTQIYEFPEIIDASTILASEITSNFYGSFDNSQSGCMIIHAKMLLHVLNYLLQQFRPYDYKGTPLPWDRSALIIRKTLTFEEITCKILDDFRILSQVELGNIERKFLEIDDSDALIYNYMKERQIERVIMHEACEEEDKWVNYLFEETQVKFDIADMVLYHLLEEIIKDI